jgi:hypothetical protein
MPKFTAHCRTAAIQGRHFFGHVGSLCEHCDFAEEIGLSRDCADLRKERVHSVAQTILVGARGIGGSVGHIAKCLANCGSVACKFACECFPFARAHLEHARARILKQSEHNRSREFCQAFNAV